MKRIFKKNQIIITVLALLIAAAGYINYSDGVKKKNNKAANANADSAKEIISNDVDIDMSGDVQKTDIDNPGDTVFTSITTSQFIISARLDREQIRAGNKETLLEIINNENLTESDKALATEKIVALTDAAEKEAAAELMLEAKGFKNVIVSINNDKVDVVVEKEVLTDTELAQIEDIVTRKTEISVDNMTITPYMG